MLFRRAGWLYGAALSLESMRRGFLGGTGLSLFIIKGNNLEAHAQHTLNLLGKYLVIEAEMLGRMPDFLIPFIFAWIDHHDAYVTFLIICEELVAKQAIPVGDSCAYYWGEGG